MEELDPQKGIYNSYKYYTDLLDIKAHSITWSPKNPKESYLLIGGGQNEIVIIDNYTSSREHGVHYPIGSITLNVFPLRPGEYGIEGKFHPALSTPEGTTIIDKKETTDLQASIVGLSMPDSPVYYKEKQLYKRHPEMITIHRLILALLNVEIGGKHDYLLVCISWLTHINNKTWETEQIINIDAIYPFHSIYNIKDKFASLLEQDALQLIYYHPLMDVVFVGIPGLSGTGKLYALSIYETGQTSELIGQFHLEPWIGNKFYKMGKEGLITSSDIWHSSSLYSIGYNILSHIGPGTVPETVSLVSHIPEEKSKLFTQLASDKMVEVVNFFDLCKNGECSICPNPYIKSGLVYHLYTSDGYTAKLEFKGKELIEGGEFIESIKDAVDPFVDIRSEIKEENFYGLFCSFSPIESDRIYFINLKEEKTIVYYMRF